MTHELVTYELVTYELVTCELVTYELVTCELITKEKNRTFWKNVKIEDMTEKTYRLKSAFAGSVGLYFEVLIYRQNVIYDGIQMISSLMIRFFG